MKYTPPRIGEYWQEKAGIYCGTIARPDEEQDGYLILMPTPKIDCTLGAAQDYAETMITGNTLWWLPTIEQLMLIRSNCPKQMSHGSYWSAEIGSFIDSAWCMEINDYAMPRDPKIQFFSRFKNHEGIACAVYVAPISSGVEP